MSIAASGMESSGDALPQHAPVQDVRTKLVAPYTHSPPDLFGRIETAIFFAEDQMVRPRDANDVHGFKGFNGSLARANDDVGAVGSAAAEDLAEAGAVSGAPLERHRHRAVHFHDQRHGQRAGLSQRALCGVAARDARNVLAARPA